jgi:hypothetical protein
MMHSGPHGQGMYPVVTFAAIASWSTKSANKSNFFIRYGPPSTTNNGGVVFDLPRYYAFGVRRTT